MTSVADFKQIVTMRGNTRWEQWVSAFISDVRGLGQHSLTYMGCNKKVRRKEGEDPWFCRKQIGEGVVLPNEVNNHQYVHEGGCSRAGDGIRCFGVTVLVSDDSGGLRAEVWAPAMYLFGCTPIVWHEMDSVSQSERLRDACSKPFDMLLTSVYSSGSFSHFKVSFVRPEGKDIMPIIFKGNINSLSASLGSLAVGSDRDGDTDTSESSADFTRVHKVERSLTLLEEVQKKNEEVTKLLQRLLEDLKTVEG